MANLVRFDWAIKRLLRNKADYCVVEGLLSVIMERQIRIKSILESEGNKETAIDKFNRVDMLCENEQGELMIFEIQNNHQLDYFHRMTYGMSKVMSEYLREGQAYSNIRKIYSIDIVYFSLGQGNDYAYHGTTRFVSMHDDTEARQLSLAQKDEFKYSKPADIYPEYYLFRVDKFNKIPVTPLDEWISFLKTGEIPQDATAQGLAEARERLRMDSLSEDEQKEYKRMMENLRYQASVIETGRLEGIEKGREEGIQIGRAEGEAKGRAEGREEGIAEGEAKGREEERRKAHEEKLASARALKATGTLTDSQIAEIIGLSEDEVTQA